MKVSDLIGRGDLSGAILLATEEVTLDPLSAANRLTLVDVLLVDGQYGRADRELETALRLYQDYTPYLIEYRRLLAAATERRACYVDGRPPQLSADDDLLLRLQADLFVQMYVGEHERADRLLAELQPTLDRLFGTCDGVPFRGFSDSSAGTASCFEVLTPAGEYHWLPITQVAAIDFSPPKMIRDLVWRMATIELRSGAAQIAYLPAVYADMLDEDQSRLKLGHSTRWTEPTERLAIGHGQRIFWLGSGEVSMLQIRRLEFGSEAEVDSRQMDPDTDV
jgi:protein involved in temperature-dependent protein secretion